MWQLAGDFLINILNLVEYVALLLIVFYILFQLKFFYKFDIQQDSSDKKVKPTKILLLIVLFGLLSVYSTVSGIKIGGAIANTRDLSVITAGMLGGPLAGIGAGLIGGIHRYFYGGFTALPCAIATVMAGMAGGIFYFINKGKFISPLYAALFAVVMEVFHMLLVLLLSKPTQEAVSVVQIIALPMILANAIGLTLFSFMIKNFSKQQELAATEEKIKAELDMINSLQTNVLPQITQEMEGNQESTPSIEMLIPYMTKEHFTEGELLFQKDDQADKLFYILHGLLELVEINKIVGEGCIIGEIGIFSPFHKRTVSARCHTELEVYSIDQDKMMQLLYKIPHVFIDLIRLTIRRFTVNLKDSISEKEKIESELKIAHSIQSSMLPREFPPFPERTDIEIFATMKPAKEVGGDFYDFALIDQRRLYFAIGDVAGKGIPAALFMAISKTLLKNEVLRGISPGEILINVNNILYPDNEECMFVTVFCGILDTETGELGYANAGHNPPLICKKNGTVQFMDVKSGFVLAGMGDIHYETYKIKLEPGDVIFLYTDGVTEAVDEQEEQFSSKRLKKTIEEIAVNSGIALIENIEKTVNEFSGGVSQSDDITMLALQYFGKDTIKR